MNNRARIAHHRRAAAALVDAYREGSARGRIELWEEELKIVEECTFWSPKLGKGVELSFGKRMADRGYSFSQAATREMEVYWHYMPDFAAVGRATTVVGEEGWALLWKFQGTTRDGRVLQLHQADYVRTNAKGAIVRWEALSDWAEFQPILELIVGEATPEGVEWDDYFAAIVAFHEGGS